MRGLSQVDLAGRLGVTQGAVSKVEAAVDPRVSSIRTYLAAMGADLRMYAVVDGDELRIIPNPSDDLEEVASRADQPVVAAEVQRAMAAVASAPSGPDGDPPEVPVDTRGAGGDGPDDDGGGAGGTRDEPFDDEGLRIVFFKITRTYRPGMSDEELYRNTSGFWRMNWERHDPDYAMAVVDGHVVGVFEIEGWRRPEQWEIAEHDIRDGRWAFVGRRDRKKEKRWLHVDVSEVTRGQNPVTYFNC